MRFDSDRGIGWVRGLLGRTMAPGKFVPSGWSVVYFAFLVVYYTIYVSVSVWYMYLLLFVLTEYEIDV
jgi:hypothetical protein